MRERSSYLSSAYCFVAGAFAGAGLSLLLAPQSGQDTRRQMTRKLSGTADSARQLRDRVVTRGAEAWDEASHRVADAATALSGGAERKGNGTETPAV
jgi:gas vesicle protein